jgi:hemerythrin-like domain-containing protein
MKATELLVNQHHEFEQLFEQLESVEEGDEKIVREELARNLVGHMAIEEEMFYPAMRDAMPERIALAEMEHAAARYALAQLLATPPGDPMFHAKVAVLDTMIRNHVAMEEKEILPRAENAIGTEQLQQLSRRMEGRFEQVVSEDFMGMLKQKLMHEMPQMMMMPRAMPTTATKKRAVRATAKKATPAKRGAKRATTAKRGATAKRGGAATKRTPATKRGAETKRTNGMKRAAPATRQTGAAGRPSSKRATRKRAS